MLFKEYKSKLNKDSFQGVPFQPTKINHEWSWCDTIINNLLVRTAYNMGKLNEMVKRLPNSKLIYSMTIFDEAIQSNKIEGTYTEKNTEDNKSELEHTIESITENDLKSVFNFIRASDYALEEVEKSLEDNVEKPIITSKFIHNIHKMIVDDSSKGKYKTEQNLIGGNTKYDARFIPAPPNMVKDLMKDFFDFINNESLEMPFIMKIAIAHYQFETIHPYNDGNGRIGRLLIPIYLMNKKVLKYPVFLSRILGSQRMNYYDNLDVVRHKDDMGQWIKFFLVSFNDAIKENIKKIDLVDGFIEDAKNKIKKGYKNNPTVALDFLESILKRPFEEYSPYITSTSVKEKMQVSMATANSLLSNFEKMEILEEKTGFKRNKKFMFSGYFRALSGKEKEGGEIKN